MRGVRWLVSIVGLLAAFAVASPAQGSVTIGHVLGTGPSAPLQCFPTCTLRQASLAPEDGLSSDGLTSPVNGVAFSFGVNVVAANQAGNLTIRLRVLRGRTGAATSSPMTLVDADGVQNFATELPIAVGDGIGLDTLPTAAPGSVGIGRGTAAVEPTNTFRFGKLARDKKKGTATLSVTVPNAGTVVVGGKGVKRARKSVTAPGAVTLKIRAKGKQLRKLKNSGKVKLSARVTFTPTAGDAKARSKKVSLKKKR